jgi:hypothetical protein
MKKIISITKTVVLLPIAVLALSLTYVFAGKAEAVKMLKSAVRSANAKTTGTKYAEQWSKS